MTYDIWEIYGMRLFKELTQQEFANQLGYSRNLISDVENMRKNPSVNFLISFNRTFGQYKTPEFYLFLSHLKKISYKYPI